VQVGGAQLGADGRRGGALGLLALLALVLAHRDGRLAQRCAHARYRCQATWRVMAAGVPGAAARRARHQATQKTMCRI